MSTARRMRLKEVFRPMLASKFGDQEGHLTTTKEVALLMGAIIRRRELIKCKKALEAKHPLLQGKVVQRKDIPESAELESKLRVNLKDVNTLADLSSKLHLPPYFVSPKYDGVRCVATLEYSRFTLNRGVYKKKLIAQLLRMVQSRHNIQKNFMKQIASIYREEGLARRKLALQIKRARGRGSFSPSRKLVIQKKAETESEKEKDRRESHLRALAALPYSDVKPSSVVSESRLTGTNRSKYAGLLVSRPEDPKLTFWFRIPNSETTTVASGENKRTRRRGQRDAVARISVQFQCRTGAAVRCLVPQGELLSRLVFATVRRWSPRAESASVVFDGELCAFSSAVTAQRGENSPTKAAAGGSTGDGTTDTSTSVDDERMDFETTLSVLRSAQKKIISSDVKCLVAQLPLRIFDVAQFRVDGNDVIKPRTTAFPDRLQFLKSLPIQVLHDRSFIGAVPHTRTGLVSVVEHTVVHDFRQIRSVVGPALIRRYKVEGVVIRTASNVYEPGQRSHSMFKLVPWKSAEFPILAFRGVSEAGAADRSRYHTAKKLRQRGYSCNDVDTMLKEKEKLKKKRAQVESTAAGSSGNVIGSIECLTDRGGIFRVPGTNISQQNQRMWWSRRHELVGALATVEFHSLNKATGIPRHPFLKAIRSVATSNSVTASATAKEASQPSNALVLYQPPKDLTHSVAGDYSVM